MDTEGCAQAYAPLGAGGTKGKSVAVFTDTVLPTIIHIKSAGRGDADIGPEETSARTVLSTATVQ